MRNRESSFLVFDRMLARELRLHCTDELIMGGLGPYSERWQREANADASSDQDRALVARVVERLAGYATLSPEERAQAVTDCRAILADLQHHTPAHEPGPHDTAEAPQDDVATPETSAPEEEAAATAPAAIMAEPRPAPSHVIAEPRPAQAPIQHVMPAPRPYGLDAAVTTLTGINVGYAAKLAKLGVRTVRDLLYLYPRRYNDFSRMKRISQLEIGAIETVVGTVWDVQNVTGRNNRVRTEVTVEDESGKIKAVWFNQPYMAQTLRRGLAVVLSGKIDVYLGRQVMESPEYEILENEDLLHTGRLVPVYPLTEGIGERWMRRLQKRVVDRWASQVSDVLPVEIRERSGLPVLQQSLAQIHFPDTLEALEQARRRLAFDELFLIQLALMRRRQQWQHGIVGTPMSVDRSYLDQVITQGLPFTLTEAQQKVLDAILEDIQLPTPMARLLQGDVGSGKTVVALLAMLVVVANNCQAAIMAPTEILARQHFKTIISLLINVASYQAQPATEAALAALQQSAGANELPDLVEIPPSTLLPSGMRVARLIGSLSEAGKQEVRSALAAGTVNIAIGTHALLEESVSFSCLGFAVIDEQHRFGVMQRAVLRQKGRNPHILVMTATPIPRTLALTMYGDLDISVIDQLPPGRQIIKTRWLEPRDRERAYNFIRRQVQDGHQAFVICPLVEESEAMEAKAAVEEYERLKTQVFPDLRMGLVHGRLKGAEKDETMAHFARAELDVLVATAVVEVGIDVPNATVMLIEGANHFGLSQLHQFRGRVGRGAAQSYCILLSETSRLTEDNPRLQAIEQTNDGFKLAEIDLELRGMGEFFGTRQSGLPDLRVARLSDMAILEQAREQAKLLIASDQDLSAPEHQAVLQKVLNFWQAPSGEGDVS